MPAPDTERNDPLVSVIVPVYNTAATLTEALDSIADQTLGKEEYEIIVVDDCSTDEATRGMIAALEKSPQYRGVALRVIRHETNRWSAEARNTGMRAARGEFVCCPDSDDRIAPDYLLKSVIALRSEPTAGWVIPRLKTFGMYVWEYVPEKFDVRRLLRENYCVGSGMVRKAAWLQTGPQRTVPVTARVKWFEDWDFWIRMAGQGWFAVPVKDTIYYYRKSTGSSNMDRTPATFLLSVYLVMRANMLNLFRSWRAHHAWKKANASHKRRLSLFSSLANVLFVPLINRLFSLEIRPMRVGEILRAIFAPKTFIRYSIDRKLFLNRIMVECGFEEAIDLSSLPIPVPTPVVKKGRTLLMAHYWWHYGGAELVYLSWMKAIAESGMFDRIIEVALEEGKEPDLELMDEARQYSHEQYVLKGLATHPVARLNAAWEIVRQHSPSVVFTMSNPFLYHLLPLIKEHLPQSKTCDLLHAIGIEDPGWFGASMEYRESLDRRIVISPFWRDYLSSKQGEAKEKISVAMNAIDLHQFAMRSDRTSAKRRLGIHEDKFTVTYIGRLSEEKNIGVISRLIEECAHDDRFTFLIIGSGPEEKETRKRLGAFREARFMGHTHNTVPYYEASDLILMPSKMEGYPMVGIEAAAMQVPMIGSNVPGIREQIQLGNFGFTYDSVDEWHDALSIKELMYKHFNQWPEIGARGRAFAQQHHDYEKQKKVYQEVIGSLLAS